MPEDLERKRKRQREWKAKRRADFFIDKYCVYPLHVEGVDMECGSTVDLRLDHIEPATKTDHRIWSWSEVRRKAELAKCQVLCEYHHKRKTVAAGNHLYRVGANDERNTNRRSSPSRVCTPQPV